MSVKHALLALLSAGPASTYALRGAFDAATGQVWPLNIGQASGTLARCERDALVRREPGEDEDQGAGLWHLTPAGQEEVRAWFAGAVVRPQPDRQELVMKLALAVSVPGVDVAALVQHQRDATLSVMHDATRARRAVEAGDLAGALVLDHHLFSLESELRWLDTVETTMHRAAGGRTRPAARAEIPAAPARVEQAHR